MGGAAFDARCASFFEEAHAINAELNAATAAAAAAGGAGAGDDDEDRLGGVHVNPDALSPEAFVALCDRYGLVPLRRAGFVAAEGDAAASDAAAAVVSPADEAFAPVARPPPIAVRRTSVT